MFLRETILNIMEEDVEDRGQGTQAQIQVLQENVQVLHEQVVQMETLQGWVAQLIVECDMVVIRAQWAEKWSVDFISIVSGGTTNFERMLNQVSKEVQYYRDLYDSVVLAFERAHSYWESQSRSHSR